jgi:CheY-like chemotaxis protein
MDLVQRSLAARGTVIVAHRGREILLQIRSALQARGLAVRTTMRGERALRLARELDPEVIVFGWRMPDIDGRQFIEQLKNDHRTVDIPIIVMLENAEREKDLDAYNEVQFVKSPFDPAKLAEDISNRVSDDVARKEL